MPPRLTIAAAARAEVAGFPEELRKSTLAAAVLDLAHRLDERPGDRDAAGMVRELRLALTALRGWAAETREVGLDVSDATMGH